MSAFADWFDSIFGSGAPAPPGPAPAKPKAEEGEPWDVVNIPLEGMYPNAVIIRASIQRSQISRLPFCVVRLRLRPKNPEDLSTVATHLNRQQYVRLLRRLCIPRTNDVTVLEGRRTPCEITLLQTGYQEMQDPKPTSIYYASATLPEAEPSHKDEHLLYE
jgi:hypothetical protein